jgi:hypothetical protein
VAIPELLVYVRVQNVASEKKLIGAQNIAPEKKLIGAQATDIEFIINIKDIQTTIAQWSEDKHSGPDLDVQITYVKEARTKHKKGGSVVRN